MVGIATSTLPSRQEVETWLAGVRTEIQRVAAMIAPLVAEQGLLQDREAILLKLLGSFNESRGEAAAPVQEVVASGIPPEGSMREHVRSHVIEILQAHGGGKMHINDIHAKFLAKGLHVPGAGRPANLTAHLGRCEGVVSPSRGFYALGVAASKPGRRRRRKRA